MSLLALSYIPSHGEILITKQKPVDAVDRHDVPHPIASAATLALCGGNAKDEDPWAKQDPMDEVSAGHCCTTSSYRR